MFCVLNRYLQLCLITRRRILYSFLMMASMHFHSKQCTSKQDKSIATLFSQYNFAAAAAGVSCLYISLAVYQKCKNKVGKSTLIRIEKLR